MTFFGYLLDTHGGPYQQPEPGPVESANFADQLVREAEEVETCGFDGVFVPERHARTECLFPSTLTLMAALSTRTRQISLGSYVIMPALYDPIHLAEQAAMIDVLSRGRLIMGVGVGYHTDYFRHFGVPIHQREGRFEESLDLLNRAWTNTAPFNHHGQYYNYDAVHVTPKPFQKPRPPIWIGAFGPKSIARAGRLGDVWSMAPFFDSFDTLRGQLEIYREAAIKAGKPPRVALLRDGWLASSMDEAETVFGALWIEECKFYLRMGMLTPNTTFTSESDFTLEKVRPYMMIGTKDDWLEHLDLWQRQLGVDYFVIRCRVPMGPKHEQVLECIHRIGDEVLPTAKQQ